MFASNVEPTDPAAAGITTDETPTFTDQNELLVNQFNVSDTEASIATSSSGFAQLNRGIYPE